jgi:glycine cleavage system H protein
MVSTRFYKRSSFVAHLPEGYLYTPSHYWMTDEGEGVWRVGYTKFATRMLGELVDAGFEVGEGADVVVGGIVGSLEGFKAISDIYAVVAGIFVGANPLLKGGPEVVSKDPFGEGWLYRIRGVPDPQAMGIEGYVGLLDGTIDRILKSQDGEGH